jgi:hypothetical protein
VLGSTKEPAMIRRRHFVGAMLILGLAAPASLRAGDNLATPAAEQQLRADLDIVSFEGPIQNTAAGATVGRWTFEPPGESASAFILCLRAHEGALVQLAGVDAGGGVLVQPHFLLRRNVAITTKNGASTMLSKGTPVRIGGDPVDGKTVTIGHIPCLPDALDMANVPADAIFGVAAPVAFRLLQFLGYRESDSTRWELDVDSFGRVTFKQGSRQVTSTVSAGELAKLDALLAQAHLEQIPPGDVNRLALVGVKAATAPPTTTLKLDLIARMGAEETVNDFAAFQDLYDDATSGVDYTARVKPIFDELLSLVKPDMAAPATTSEGNGAPRTTTPGITEKVHAR